MFEQIVSLIGTVGFPISACIVMAWYVYRTTDECNKRVDSLNDKVTTALNNNTLVLQKLCDKLE